MWCTLFLWCLYDKLNYAVIVNSNEIPRYLDNLIGSYPTYPKYWDTFIFYLNCPKILTNPLNYSRLSLSRLRLSRITAYLKVKNKVPVLTWKSNNKQQNIVDKRRNCSSGAISPLFLQYFQYTSNFRSQITYSVVKYGFQFIFSSIPQI